MKILIINNNSKYIQELALMFPGADIVNKKNLRKDLNLSNYDLAVLSGGSNVPTVLRHPEEYFFEINLIKKGEIPVLGICLGAEIICEAYGGELHELSEEHRGTVKIKIEDITLKNLLELDKISVIEGHKIGIKTLPRNFISCASSEHGVEIFRHRDYPIVGFQFHPEISNNKNIINWVFEKLNLNHHI